jgi:hypothetical protein
MLPEVERRERFDRTRRERKAAVVKQSFDLVAAHEWQKAERLVLQMETEFPNDDEVAKSRNYLNHARRLNEQETVAREKQEVERLLSIADWNDALVRARALVNGFPGQRGSARAAEPSLARTGAVRRDQRSARLRRAAPRRRSPHVAAGALARRADPGALSRSRACR